MTTVFNLLDIHLALNLLHFLGAVMAVGAVIVTDLINGFLHFRADFAEWDAKIAPLLSLMVWTGFLILSVTGTLMFLREPALIHDTIFQAKMLFVAAVFLNGVFLNIWVTPKFKELSDEWEDRTDKVKAFEVIAGISATVSLVGWLTVLVLGYLLTF